MTSTHSSHTSHSSHGSCAHSSSPATNVSYKKDNKTTASGNPSWSGSLSGSHSVSITNPTVSNSTKLGVYGSTGSLTLLKNACTTARNSLTSLSGSAYPSDVPKTASPSEVATLLTSVRGTRGPVYANGTLTVDTKATHANSTGTGTSHSQHASTSTSNDLTKAASLSESVTAYTQVGSYETWAGGQSSKQHANSPTNTAHTIHASTSTPKASNGEASITNSTSIVTSGQKITKSNLSDILKNIKIVSSTVSSFGTYKHSGTYAVTHTNHSSHGSHSSHSSHASHGSHSNHSSCSIEVKENIKDTELEALNTILGTNIVEFYYKNDPDKIKHYGFIAEDTSEALATQYHDRMDYTNCIGLLMKSIQELNNKVNELNEKYEYVLRSKDRI